MIGSYALKMTFAQGLSYKVCIYRYIIQTWVPQTDVLPKQLLGKGYKLIMSTKDAWYFDHGFWGQTRYYTWKMAYRNRLPRDRNVLGGEACVWTELIDRNSLGKKN